MADGPPLIVEGDWDPSQSKNVKLKLQLYFQSKKKSGGGDCRVELEDNAARVYFNSGEVRQQVLQRDNHQILLGEKTIKLKLSSEASHLEKNSTSNQTDSGASSDLKSSESESEPEAGSAADQDVKAGLPPAVVLENISDNLSRDLLLLMVEAVSGVNENNFGLEIIRESHAAVVTFSSPAVAEKFMTVCEKHPKLQKHGLTARPLEKAKSVRVESLPSTASQDMLELWLEKIWVLPNNIVMIPEEQAAIVSFSDPKVVESICSTVDHMMRSTPLKLYSYYESLGSALYGKDRPTWEMPKPFTERVHPVIWKFLHMKSLWKSISDQMNPHFCSVKIDDPEAKLSPLQSFLWQKGLTAKDVDNWKQNAQQAFQRLMSEYLAFECVMSTKAWRVAEMDIRSVTNGEAAVDLDASREVLCVAGRADDLQKIRAPVENIVLKAMRYIERQEKGITEDLQLSSAWFYILKQEGLQRAATDISPELLVSYDEGTKKLTMKGLPEEVSKMKSWILEKNTKMAKKSIFIPPALLEYLNTMDPMDMSQNLFTSHGISAVYCINIKGIVLMGTSDKVLSDAEDKIRAELLVQSLDVKDEEVLNLKNWEDLKKNLLDTYNSANKKTVTIHLDQERQLKVTVAGFMNPVKEVSRDLKKFIEEYSRVNEKVRVHSSAALEFIDKRKKRNWLSIAKDNKVFVKFDSKRSRMTFSGAQINVQKTKSSILEMVHALHTDTLTVDKPGAKKFFQSQGSLFLSTILTPLNCVVLLQSEIPDEEEEESYGEENSLCYCKVQTNSGVQLCVSRGDICSFSVDAVVNAANEDLQHIGGLALALLKAAGPELQKLSDDYVAKNGKLRPGDAVVTDACNLSCKYVIHAVGPRFSNSDKKTSVSRLKSAVKQSLRQADSVSCSSIALPAISSGIFGFPVQLCAETIAQAVREFCDSPQGPRSLTEIYLVDNKEDTIKVMATAVSKEFSDLGPVVTIPQQRSNKDSKPSGDKLPSRGNQGELPRRHPSAERGAEGGPLGNHQVNRGNQSPKKLSRYDQHWRQRGAEQVTANGLKIVLHHGNIEDQTTDVIVNTIANDLNLTQGAVSSAILKAAGPRLQRAVHSESRDLFSRVVVTDGFNLNCQKVFHAICPAWDSRGGNAMKELVAIIHCCLEEAEQSQMASLSFPALGTGNLGFPKDLVAQVLLKEIHSFSCRSRPRYLKEAVIVVHPSDRETVECFTREFYGNASPRNTQPMFQGDGASAPPENLRHSKHSPASSSGSFSVVSSPSLGVYHMQLGQLTLEVSSGDITKESCDVIVNSSNPTFDLYAGVSKAILDCAGAEVQRECAQIVKSSPHKTMIMTSAGQLPCTNIIHVPGQNDPANIKSTVYDVLKYCEGDRVTSVAFPALGTGQGGVNPSAVADAMVDAVVDFVRKKSPQFVQSVKILIFQTQMMSHFHNSMRKRQGEEVQEKGLFGKIKDGITSLLGFGGHQPPMIDHVLQKEEFDPAVFQLCAENKKDVNVAKERITDLIMHEQAKRTISDQYINQLSPADVKELNDLQKKLTVSIYLERGKNEEEPKIHLEGLTRDVYSADASIRDIIRKVERNEILKNKAILVSGLVEWQYQKPSGSMVPFDIYMNLKLEDALEKKQPVKIQINNRDFDADPEQRKASDGRNFIELLRKDLKEDTLPSHWDPMNTATVALFPVAARKQEYKNVLKNLKQNGLNLNIISIERVQNFALWKSYELLKKQMEQKNKHKKNERILFHGTTDKSIDLINKNGFNRSYAGLHGAMFGKGSYFAVDPAYSAQNYAQPDNQGLKRMYQARVLVGDFTHGNPSLIVPPSKSGQSADLYDSVADNKNPPSMFVVFNDIQAYPEYLITFT
ncbi:Poly [ADP-ribose] polymerase 14 [Oryzias melastigma]|uniref:Poly [ADP-ribose] polymerase n=1 Tax=Oryzias melastigma TaxID=30732 RepID=A0A834BN63_ORYME|nr:Poly [ADP-ribose] polymerase 14 [Oryzias melastigma]